MTEGTTARVLLVTLQTDIGVAEAGSEGQTGEARRMRVVRGRETRDLRLLDAAEPLAPDAVPLRVGDACEAAEMVVGVLAESPDASVVAVALDQVSAFTLWHVVQHLPDVLAVNTLEAGERIAALVRGGRSVASVLSVPQFSVSRVLAKHEGGEEVPEPPPAVTTTSDPAAMDGTWLGFGTDGLRVAPELLPQRDRLAISRLPAADRHEGRQDDRRLAIGPANFAGQGWLWSRAVSEHAGVTAANIAVRTDASRIVFHADLPMTVSEWSRPASRAAIAADFLQPSTHVLVEAARPLVAVDAVDPGDHGHIAESARRDVEALLDAGKQVALLFHGSEVRDPAAHASLDAWSPFGDPANDGLTGILAARVGSVRKALLRDLDVVRYVSTLDLVDYVPGAVWLPVVVDRASLAAAPDALQGPIPVVGHAPTSSVLKGSRWIDPVLEKLDSEGVIRYRRFRSLPPAAVPRMLRDVDVLVDQIVLGNPGVLAAQGMAAGRLVVSHLPESVRRRFPEPIPVVEANPSTLEEVMRAIASSPALYAETAAAGRRFARTFHDGRAAAQAFGPGFLDLPASSDPVSVSAEGTTRW